MPVLAPLRASAVEASATSDTFVNVCETAALAAGVPYLVLVAANSLSTNNNSTTALTEATFGGSRYALSRYRVGSSFIAPNSGSGGPLPTAYVVTGDGVSTVAVRHRRENGTGNVTTTAHIQCIPLDSLQEGLPGVLDQSAGDHWARSEAANSDTLTVPAASSGWVGSGQFVDVTPDATGAFLVIAVLEGEFTAGHTVADRYRARCRVTEDPGGTPTAYNLMRNEVGAVEGPETEISGGSSWGNYALGQRWADVLTLTAGTTYRFEPEWEGIATTNIGYRRARVFVFDISVWVGFTALRVLTGQNGQDQTLGTLSAPAPATTHDRLLLGAMAHNNGTTWMNSGLVVDPAGTPSRLPAPSSGPGSGGFGTALINTGVQADDDYGLIALQWDRPSVSAAEDYAINGYADLQNCRFGTQRGVFPAANNGVATVLISWGMETTTSAPSGDMTGDLRRHRWGIGLDDGLGCDGRVERRVRRGFGHHDGLGLDDGELRRHLERVWDDERWAADQPQRERRIRGEQLLRELQPARRPGGACPRRSSTSSTSGCHRTPPYLGPRLRPLTRSATLTAGIRASRWPSWPSTRPTTRAEAPKTSSTRSSTSRGAPMTPSSSRLTSVARRTSTQAQGSTTSSFRAQGARATSLG